MSMETYAVEAGREQPLALALLVREHEEIEQAFARLESAVSDQDRASARTQLLETVERHLALEETVLYPALDEAEGLEPLRRRGEEEHEELRRALARIGDECNADSGELRHARLVFERHRGGEEEEVFPLVQRKLGERLSELAVELEQHREAAKGAYGVG